MKVAAIVAIRAIPRSGAMVLTDRDGVRVKKRKVPFIQAGVPPRPQ